MTGYDDDPFTSIDDPFTADDPFSPVDLTVEYVSSASGSGKTITAVRQAIDDADRGQKTIFAMPTLELVREMVEFARRDPSVPVYEITSASRPAKDDPIEQKITNHLGRVKDGHLLFVTHEGLNRVTEWPAQAAGFHLVIDEAPEVILSRRPFMLRDSHWVLTSFLYVAPVPTTLGERDKRGKPPPVFTYDQSGRGTDQKTDESRLRTCEMIAQPTSNAAPNVKEGAAKLGLRLLAKQRKWEDWRSGRSDRSIASAYYRIVPKLSEEAKDPLTWLKRRERGKPVDDIYQYLDPIARWLLQGAALFTDLSAWNKVTAPDQDAYKDFRRGLLTITGFRRPEALRSFQRVTVMSALFEHTMAYAVWSKLGVRLEPSSWVKLRVPTSPLGSRRLRIYWLSEQGWSKNTRDKSGGITPILEFIKSSGVLDASQPVCVVTNKDDATEANPTTVTEVFPDAVVMPNNSKGQNRWRHYHQLIHCAALNSFTPDIRWVESALGIDARTQRIARTGQEIYQSLMRLSLRELTAKTDVTLVVMDRDVAEWLRQWFAPGDQVEVTGLDASAVIQRKLQPGRKAIDGRPMTDAERQRRSRQQRRNRGERPVDA